MSAFCGNFCEEWANRGASSKRLLVGFRGVVFALSFLAHV
jgi:hypothetical protein